MARTFGKEEFIITYKNQLDVIQDLKEKAWKATHYSILGQAGVYALHRSIDCPTAAEHLAMTILSLLIFIWVVYLVNELQGGICDRRDRANKLRDIVNDSADFSKVWEDLKKYEHPPFPKFWNCGYWCRWKDDRPIFAAYAAAIFLPTVLVSTLIWM
jgi:hypothetical protein